MNSAKKILIIKGASQYGAARYFCDELLQAFCNMGCIVAMLDLTVFPDMDCPDQFALYDMIISFDVTGIELYNTMNVKPFFWTILIDPPIYLNERLKQIKGDVMVSCIDRNHVSYIDRYYKNIPWTCFLPHGGITGDPLPKIPYCDRKYDVVILGSLQNFNDINKVINSLKAEYNPLAELIIDSAIKDLSSELSDIVLEKTKELSLNFDDITFRELMYIMRPVDALRRYYQRFSFIESLTSNGISLDIWGSGWEQLTTETNKDQLRLHGDISYNEAKNVMRDSKILLNAMPLYHDGSHERVFAAMQSGAIVASDRSIFLEECFYDHKDIIFYDPNDIEALSSTIKTLLNDPVRAQYIIDNAYVLSLNHTWSMRAASILEISDMIHQHNHV